MKILRLSVVILLCLAITLPETTGFRFRVRVRRFVSRVGRFVSRVGRSIVKPLCNVAVGVGCTAVGVPAVGCAIVTGAKPCGKRSTEIEMNDGMVYYQISDDFEEYDDNDDGLIGYEEFAFDFLARWTFTNPEQLRDIFNDADTDDDGYLDLEEFVDAPWDFGSYDVKVKKIPIYNGTPLLSEALADD